MASGDKGRAGKVLRSADSVAANAMLVAVRQSAGIICDRWSLSIVIAIILGAHRFNDLADLSLVTGGMLASRLRRLENDGLVMRIPYSRRPLRHEYRLTNMGGELLDVIAEMVRWERRWFPEARTAIGDWMERAPGEALSHAVRCSACGLVVDARSVDVQVSRALMQKMPAQQTSYRRSSINSVDRHPARSLLGVSLDLLGDTWSIEVINCAFLRLHRFSEYRDQTGIAANILADRLGRLVAVGFMRRGGADVATEGRGYWLTEEGVSFYPVLLRLQDWADKWVPSRLRSPVQLIHRPCGRILKIKAAATALSD